jgi:hypothetical protein
LRMSVSGMRKWRARGIGPAYCKLSKIIRYRQSELERFADRHTRLTGEPERGDE